MINRAPVVAVLVFRFRGGGLKIKIFSSENYYMLYIRGIKNDWNWWKGNLNAVVLTGANDEQFSDFCPTKFTFLFIWGRGEMSSLIKPLLLGQIARNLVPLSSANKNLTNS